jgi:hypothetical protein
MSLQRLDLLSDSILNIIMFVPSPSLAYYIRGKLKTRFEVYKDFVISVDTQKGFQNAKLDSYVAPLICDKWLIHVDADKIAKKDLITGLNINTSHGITVYWTSKYNIFKQLTDLDIVKKQGVHCPSFSFSRLSYGEVLHLHKQMVGKKKELKTELLDYVAKNYRYDVQAICELFAMLNSGNDFQTKKDIIESVGVGGNSVSNLVIRILRSSPTSEKGKKKIAADAIKLLDDLSVSYKYSTIRRFMLNNLDGFIDMKQLQIIGVYNRINKVIPETYDTKRLSMLKRFERTILEEISLPKLLNLKLCLLKYTDFNSEITLMQAISEYCNELKVS